MGIKTASTTARRLRRPGKRKPLSVILRKHWFIYLLVLPGFAMLILSDCWTGMP